MKASLIHKVGLYKWHSLTDFQMMADGFIILRWSVDILTSVAVVPHWCIAEWKRTKLLSQTLTLGKNGLSMHLLRDEQPGTSRCNKELCGMSSRSSWSQPPHRSSSNFSNDSKILPTVVWVNKRHPNVFKLWSAPQENRPIVSRDSAAHNICLRRRP
jgi:hypothetical protein